MKRISITCLMTLLCGLAMGQQDPQITQNMFNRLYANPGFAGSKNAICGTLLNRQQWMGFSDGTPTTTIFSAHTDFTYAPLYQNDAGVGLTVVQDELGYDKSLTAKLAYAYRQTFNNIPGYFALGVEGGLISRSLGGQWNSVEPHERDPAIPDNVTANVFDLGLGLYYHQPDKYYVGFSVLHLNEPVAQQSADNYDFRFPLYRTYYVMAGWNRQFNWRRTTEFQPSIFIKRGLSAWQVDLNANFLYNNFFWGGVTWRLDDTDKFTDNTIALLAGWNVGSVIPSMANFRIGLAYDIPLSEIAKPGGSFELMLNYCYKITPPRKFLKYRTVKWL